MNNKKFSLIISILVTLIIVIGWVTYIRDNYVFATFSCCVNSHMIADFVYNSSLIITLVFGVVIGLMIGEVLDGKSKIMEKTIKET